MFEVTRGNVLAATSVAKNKTEQMSYPVYSSQTKNDGLLGYYKDYLFEDALTWTTDGANAGTVNYRPGKFYCTNVCGVLLSNRVKANPMIAEALNLTLDLSKSRTTAAVPDSLPVDKAYSTHFFGQNYNKCSST